MRGMINLLGPLFTRAFKPGASEVKSLRAGTVSNSSTRATIVTPTSGTKIRIISVECFNLSATGTRVEIYFGTGTNISTDNTKAVIQPHLDIDFWNNYTQTWPDGGGPVGGVDEVLSLRTSVNITTDVITILHYREE